MPRPSRRRSALLRPGHGPPVHNKRILVFTEGERTEVDYINAWRREHRDTVVVIDDRHGRGPKELVNLASQKKRADYRLAQRGKQAPFDKYWCVGDVDDHRNLPGALEQAAENDIRVALSNPCIELWLLLHLQDQTAHIDRYEAQRLKAKKLGQGKGLTDKALRALLDRNDDAIKRARELVNKHEREDSGSYANPSSTVWQLIDSIRGLDEPS